MNAETPDNIRRLVPRRGQQRVAAPVSVSMTGAFVRPQSAQLPPRLQYSDTNPEINQEHRARIIQHHIAAINSLRSARGLSPLAGQDLDNVLKEAQHANPSSEAIMAAVVRAASAALPADDRKDFLDKLKANHVTEDQYNAAIARYGAGSGGFNAVMALIANMNRGTGAENSGNMSNGVNNTGSSTYPGYGGTAFANERALYSYSSTNYGINREVSNQLYNLGIRSSAQVQQVVSDVGRIGLGSGRDNPRFTNSVAPHVAGLRIAEGTRTDAHLDQASRHAEQYRRIKEEQLRAERAGDTAGMEAAKRRMEELQRDNSRYNRDEVRTPRGQEEHRKIINRTEEEVRTQLRLKHGPHASLSDTPSVQANNTALRASAGQDLEQRNLERQRAEVARAAGLPPQVAPRAGVPVAAAVEPPPRVDNSTAVRTTQRNIAALDDDGPTPPVSPTQRAETAPPSPTVVAETTPPKPEVVAKVEPPADKKPEVKTAAVQPPATPKAKGPTV